MTPADIGQQRAWIAMETLHETWLAEEDDAGLMEIERCLRVICRAERDAA